MLNVARVLVVVAATLLGGCAAQELYVAHQTVIGVNAGVNTAKSSGHLVVGYDRSFGTVVPKSVPKQDGSPGKEAMAVLSCSEVRVDGIYLSKFVEYLATGEAARKYAKALAAEEGDGRSEAIFQCFDDAKNNDGADAAGDPS